MNGRRKKFLVYLSQNGDLGVDALHLGCTWEETNTFLEMVQNESIKLREKETF